MSKQSVYWFPAKQYGWGWGLPATWQGWVVLVTYVAALVVGTLIFGPAEEALKFTVYTTVLSGLLVAVCWLKGEPPRWRWGNKT